MLGLWHFKPRKPLTRTVMQPFQLPLFPNQSRGLVFREGSRWIAIVDDGWYIAYGPTKQSAIDNVIKKMEEELDYG